MRIQIDKPAPGTACRGKVEPSGSVASMTEVRQLTLRDKSCGHGHTQGRLLVPREWCTAVATAGVSLRQ